MTDSINYDDEQDAYARRIVEVLGTDARRELLEVLSRSESERASLIGRLHQRQDASWLADLLIEIEADPDDITRLRLIDVLRRSLPEGS